MIVSLLNDREKLKSEREDYAKWRSRIEGVSSNGSASISSANYFAGSSYSSSTKPSSVSYLDRRNDDRYDRKKEENKKPVKEDSSSSSGSESEEKNKKNKHKPKKVKKESESSEDEHNPDILNNYSKKEEIKPQETKDNLSTSQ